MRVPRFLITALLGLSSISGFLADDPEVFDDYFDDQIKLVDISQDSALRSCLSDGSTADETKAAYDKCFGKNYDFNDLASAGGDTDGDGLPDDFSGNEACFYEEMGWVSENNEMDKTKIMADMEGLEQGTKDSFDQDVKECMAWSGNFGEARMKRSIGEANGVEEGLSYEDVPAIMGRDGRALGWVKSLVRSRRSPGDGKKSKKGVKKGKKGNKRNNGKPKKGVKKGKRGNRRNNGRPKKGGKKVNRKKRKCKGRGCSKKKRSSKIKCGKNGKKCKGKRNKAKKKKSNNGKGKGVKRSQKKGNGKKGGNRRKTKKKKGSKGKRKGKRNKAGSSGKKGEKCGKACKARKRQSNGESKNCGKNGKRCKGKRKNDKKEKSDKGKDKGKGKAKNKDKAAERTSGNALPEPIYNKLWCVDLAVEQALEKCVEDKIKN